jgi:flagellar basal-body rod protein FlgF
MDNLIYVATAGAKQIEYATQINNNNLANVNTPGFRADLVSAVSSDYGGAGLRSRVYVSNKNTLADLSTGSIVTTGRDLDVAVSGDGWIVVSAENGSKALTRRGDLHVNINGSLVTGDGHMVMGNSGPISIPPAQKIEIASDGTISISNAGQNGAGLTVVDRISLANPEVSALFKGEDGMFHLENEGDITPDANIKLVSGSLEKSNVNPIGALVDMIALSRSYEMQVKLIKHAENLDASAAETLRLS